MKKLLTLCGSLLLLGACTFSVSTDVKKNGENSSSSSVDSKMVQSSSTEDASVSAPDGATADREDAEDAEDAEETMGQSSSMMEDSSSTEETMEQSSSASNDSAMMESSSATTEDAGGDGTTGAEVDVEVDAGASE